MSLGKGPMNSGGRELCMGGSSRSGATGGGRGSAGQLGDATLSGRVTPPSAFSPVLHFQRGHSTRFPLAP
jgi:hypothetical protein